jgi:hypothetical protein
MNQENGISGFLFDCVQNGSAMNAEGLAFEAPRNRRHLSMSVSGSVSSILALHTWLGQISAAIYIQVAGRVDAGKDSQEHALQKLILFGFSI